MEKTKLKMAVPTESNSATKQAMFAIVDTPRIKDTKTGDKIALIPLVRYNPQSKKSEFTLGSAFIAKGKQSREDFYKSLEKGNLVKIDFKMNGQYMNIWKLFLLPKKAK